MSEDVEEIELKEGEVICNKCNGTGFDGFFLCPKCQGEKKLDWISYITGTPKDDNKEALNINGNIIYNTSSLEISPVTCKIDIDNIILENENDSMTAREYFEKEISRRVDEELDKKLKEFEGLYRRLQEQINKK